MRPLYQATNFRRAILAELEAKQLLQRDLAHVLGRSEAWLSLVLSGRKSLDPEMVDPVAEFFGLDAAAIEYLGALVDLENPSRFARAAAWASVQATQTQLASLHMGDEYVALYEHWYIQAVSELVRCEGFRPNPEWIAAALQPTIPVAQAEDALTCLLRLGMIEPDGRGGLRASAQADSWTPSIVQAGAIANAVARMGDEVAVLARDAVHATKVNERHRGSAVFTLPEGVIEEMIASLQAMERRVITDAERAHGKRNRVYLLSIHLFPVSLYTDSEELVTLAENTSESEP